MRLRNIDRLGRRRGKRSAWRAALCLVLLSGAARAAEREPTEPLWRRWLMPFSSASDEESTWRRYPYKQQPGVFLAYREPVTPPSPYLVHPPPPADGVWTLEQAIDRALQTNPDLIDALISVERQESIRVQLRARLLPQFTLTASGDLRDRALIDRSQDEIARALDPNQAGGFSPIARMGWDTRAELRQVIFDGLSIWKQTRRQKLFEKQSMLAARSVAYRTVALVRQAYDAYLWRKDMCARGERRVEALRQLAEGAARKRQLGEVAEFEQLRAEAELKSAEAELQQNLSEFARAGQQMYRLLQLKAEESGAGSLVLRGELVEREFSLPIAEAMHMAVGRRTDLQMAELQLDAAKMAVQIAKADHLPRIEVFGTYGARSSYYNVDRTLHGWTTGVVARWSVFDGLETRGRIRSQIADRRAAENRLAETQFLVSSQLQELYSTLDSSRASIRAQRAAVDLGTRGLSQARRLYEVGQVSLEQVLQSELSLRRAENQLGEALYNYNSAIAQIEYAVGGEIADSVEIDTVVQWKR